MIASEGTCRNCGSPWRMPRTEQSGDQEFGPLTHLVGNSEGAKKLLKNIQRLSYSVECEKQNITFNPALYLLSRQSVSPSHEWSKYVSMFCVSQ